MLPDSSVALEDFRGALRVLETDEAVFSAVLNLCEVKHKDFNAFQSEQPTGIFTTL